MVRIQVTEGPKSNKKELPKRKAYTGLDDDDDYDDDLNVQAIPLEDGFVPETGITCTLTQEAEEAGDVHAPSLPSAVPDDIVVIVTTPGSNRSIRAIETSDDVSREVEVEFQFWSPEAKGTYKHQVFVKSTCYLGCDVETDFQFKVLGADQIPKIEAHPLDKTLKHRWQELLANPDRVLPEESDSDDSDEDEDSEEANKRRQRWRENKAKKREDAEIKRRKAEQNLSGESSSDSDKQI